jgi:hypothetical protein
MKSQSAPSEMSVVSPLEVSFWSDPKTIASWFRYMWKGPEPKVVLDLGQVYPGQKFSPQTVYQGIVEAVERLKIPGVKIGPVAIHEGSRFSPFRVYLQIRREFSEFLVCAAPVGESFFLTVRRIDRYPHVRWFHYLFAFWFLGGIPSAFGWFRGIDAGVILLALLVALIWSVMRFASKGASEWLSDHLHELPVLGPLYLRWFRPDTFYRQDLHAAFLALVDGAVKEAIQGLNAGQPFRPPIERQGGPLAKLLHEIG